MSLDIAVRDEHGVVIAAVTGEIDISTVGPLRERLYELADNGGTLIVDLNRVTFIDSTGLGALVGTARRIAEHGGSLYAVCAQPQPRRLLWTTGVDKRIPLAATVAGALMLQEASRGSSGSGALSAGGAAGNDVSSRSRSRRIMPRGARCIRTAAAASDRVEIGTTTAPLHQAVAALRGEHMSETNGATQTARAKDEFFSAGMHMFHVTGFPQRPGVLTSKAEAPQGARLDVWRTDPASDRHIPGPGPEGVAFSAQSFSLVNSGNRTLHAPKRSWKVALEHGADDIAGMTCVNLKSMYNDPSQMREALAWRLFRRAGVPAARHTYAKLAFDATYYGLFSVIEQVDKRFLKDHFGGNHRGNLYKAYCGDVGCATLEHRTGPDGDDSGRQYHTAAADDRTYRLKSNEDDRDAGTYDDLAQFIRTINGAGLGGGEGRFDTDEFRESVDGIMNARAFLRWAAVNLLLGSWDNYYATPSNYYLYNSGHLGAEDDFMRSPYFTFIPWDYDNCLGIDYFGTKWQYTDILDWPSNTRHYWREHATSRIPLVQNLLRNRGYRQYYLDYLEFLLDTQFNPDAFSQQIAADSDDGLWSHVCQAAYLESATPYGQPFTGRQFTNDEVYLSGCKQNELRHSQEKAEGIIHYVRMRYDSARRQIEQVRREMPRATDPASFPATMEPLPPKV